MTTETGFYNIVTDGTYFYTSNTLRNVVCRISQDGSIFYEFIVIDNPICLAITQYTNRNQRLFVQTLTRIFVYEFDTPTTVTRIVMIPFVTSGQFPAMFHDVVQDKLYVSNYSQGTITTFASSFASSLFLTGQPGISGMAIAATRLYFSNYDTHQVYLLEEGTARPYLSIPSPRGLQYTNGNFYICYGRGDIKGIAVNAYGAPNYLDVFSDYLFNTNPLNTLLYSNALYITLENSNVIYRNKTPFSIGNFKEATFYNASTITQSVIAMNASCVNNPAFGPLIQLRTIGSNPNNPIPPVTTIVGRTQGAQIPFNIGLGSDYETLKMRRKAETLKYKLQHSSNNPGLTLTTKELFTNIVKYGGAYHFSKARVNQLLKENNGTLPCDIGINNGNPIVITPPTNSGIRDPGFEGYYLNPYIKYYPSL
jgi:hypothetical protein